MTEWTVYSKFSVLEFFIILKYACGFITQLSASL